MYSFLTLLILITAAADMRCAVRRRGRIFGGNDTSIYMYPHQASIEKNGRFNCGGSIISPVFVLTAGHCVVNYPVARLQVRVGSTYVARGGSVHPVEQTIIHEGYARRSGLDVNDIALARVAPPIEFGCGRQPVALCDAGERWPVGQSATISGWGDKDRAHFYPPLYLQAVAVEVADTDECARAYEPKVGRLHPGQFCAGWAGRGGRDACAGDSGGALLIANRQAGIISWGERCALPDYPTIYVSIPYYRDWIKLNSQV